MADSIKDIQNRIDKLHEEASIAKGMYESNKSRTKARDEAIAKSEKILELEKKIAKLREEENKQGTNAKNLAKEAERIAKSKHKEERKMHSSAKDYSTLLEKTAKNERGVAKAIMLGLETKLKNSDLTGDQLEMGQKHLGILNDLGGEMMDLESLAEDLRTIDDDRIKLTEIIGETQVQNLENAINQRIKNQKYMEKHKSIMGSLDDLSGGMLQKGKGIVDGFKTMGAKGAIVSGVMAAAVAILISFSGKLDALGEQFGAAAVQSGQLQSNLLQGEVAATRLGKSLEDVIAATTAMTDDFGVTLSEASALSGTIVDTGVAIGVGSAEAGKLIGSFKEIVGLSTQQAINLAKQTYLLAEASDVNMPAVMADIAESTETVAKFTHTGGENIARAAIQASRLGTTLDSVAAAAEGMLEFESSIAAEIEASVMTGKQLNLQRARELSLAGDLEGLQKEITAQVGSEAEFNAMNVLQRQALAKALGMSVADISKIVSKQEEAVTLAGQLAGQTGFDELVGEKGISTLTRLTGGLKSLGASLTNSLGPALNAVISILMPIAKVLEFIMKFLNPLIRLISTGIEAFMKPLSTAFGLASPTAPAIPQFANLAEGEFAVAISAGEGVMQVQTMNTMMEGIISSNQSVVDELRAGNKQASQYYDGVDTRNLNLAHKTGQAAIRGLTGAGL